MALNGTVIRSCPDWHSGRFLLLLRKECDGRPPGYAVAIRSGVRQMEMQFHIHSNKKLQTNVCGKNLLQLNSENYREDIQECYMA